MDNLFEIIVPLIIAGVYFFGNMLSNKSDDDAAPGAPPRTVDEDADAAERQRRIQDEIRRKIMERRRAEQGSDVPSQLAPQSSHPAESAADANLRDALEQRRRRQTSSHVPHPESRTPDLASSIPQANPYEYEMQAKLEQIEATKRQAETLKKQAQASSKKVSTSQSKTSRTHRARGPIRSTLHDPAAARAAFIYGEVLGPPVSQRKSQTVPGLS